MDHSISEKLICKNLNGSNEVKGECDPAWGILSEEKLIKIGSLRIGLTHGHQHLPWGDLTSLKGLQRKLVLLFCFAQTDKYGIVDTISFETHNSLRCTLKWDPSSGWSVSSKQCAGSF